MNCLTATEDVRRVRLTLRRTERAIQSANNMGCSIPSVDISTAIDKLKTVERDTLEKDVSDMSIDSILANAGRIARIVASQK